MSRLTARLTHDQAGYTLIEVIISAAIGAILLAGLTSVVLTSVRANDVASSRVEASAQIRSFESFAYQDFAHAGVPAACGSQSAPCTTQPIALSGPTNNSVNPVGVTYTWDGSSVVARQVGSDAPIPVATGVTRFSWYVDQSAALPTVIVSMTVTVQESSRQAYSQSQTFLFYPRVNP